MALRIKLGAFQELPVGVDQLGRVEVGWFPRMTEQEAYEAGRGCWRLGERVKEEKFVLIVGGGKVRAVVEIESLLEFGDRRAFEGTVLAEGHPLREAYLGEPDPVTTTSRNPITYLRLPEEETFLRHACACGRCDEQVPVGRDFVSGHDLRGIYARISEQFDGSVVALLKFLDAHAPG